jgi:hypothetical protein
MKGFETNPVIVSASERVAANWRSPPTRFETNAANLSASECAPFSLRFGFTPGHRGIFAPRLCVKKQLSLDSKTRSGELAFAANPL